MRGEVYRLPARGSGHQQRGRRFAVVLQPDWLNLSTWVIAFTSDRSLTGSASRLRSTVSSWSHITSVSRPATDTAGRKLVSRALVLEEMQRVDEPRTLVLDL